MVDARQNGPAQRAKFRCAVYTRKSSEEGLEQEFNSLDAQRQACEAYVVNQRHEGWTALPTLYDDGAYSGGKMERPALQRMLEDIRARKIDVVVVNKVDRLTRSLADLRRKRPARRTLRRSRRRAPSSSGRRFTPTELTSTSPRRDWPDGF